uniref:Terpene synthase metal-binding domain-containing protein n=1 Tax=Kalanchoe fedtschenkoi TaxID=63787 RepID=A0A7N0ZTL3_KALFE
MAADLNPRLKALVTNALKFPIHKNMPWLQARKYISTYQEDESHDKILLKLAKFHFNVLQKQHKQELSHLSKWWKDVDIVSKCPYARDRLVEGYFWALVEYYEPHYSLGRKFFAMAIAYIAVLDDTYDAYGTADELELITESINRFNTSLFEEMPPYARALCETVFGVFSIIEKDLLKDGKVAFSLPYVKEAMKLMAKSYHNEYFWLKKMQIPTMEEYRQLSFASSGITSLLILSYAGMGDIVTEEALDWIFSEPAFVIASQRICRFHDDIVSHEFEQERHHIPSAVECYMNQYKVSIEEARQYLRKQISDSWITINEEFLKPNAFPFPALERVLNISRSMEVMYGDGDGFTHSQKFMEPKITSLLKDPVPI